MMNPYCFRMIPGDIVRSRNEKLPHKHRGEFVITRRHPMSLHVCLTPMTKSGKLRKHTQWFCIDGFVAYQNYEVIDCPNRLRDVFVYDQTQYNNNQWLRRVLFYGMTPDLLHSLIGDYLFSVVSPAEIVQQFADASSPHPVIDQFYLTTGGGVLVIPNRHWDIQVIGVNTGVWNERFDYSKMVQKAVLNGDDLREIVGVTRDAPLSRGMCASAKKK